MVPNTWRPTPKDDYSFATNASLVAPFLLVAMHLATSSFSLPVVMQLVTSSFLLLVAHLLHIRLNMDPLDRLLGRSDGSSR